MKTLKEILRTIKLNEIGIVSDNSKDIKILKEYEGLIKYKDENKNGLCFLGYCPKNIKMIMFEETTISNPSLFIVHSEYDKLMKMYDSDRLTLFNIIEHFINKSRIFESDIEIQNNLVITEDMLEEHILEEIK